MRQAVTDGVSTPTLASISVTSAWQRFVLTKAIATTATYVEIYVDGTGGGGLVYAWGGKLELGSTVSSYIPTTTAGATCAADRQYLSGQAIDAAAGLAVIAEFTGQAGGQTAVPVCFMPAIGRFAGSWYLSQDGTTGRIEASLLDSAHGNYSYALGLVAGLGTTIGAAASIAEDASGAPVSHRDLARAAARCIRA